MERISKPKDLVEDWGGGREREQKVQSVVWSCTLT